MSSNTLSQRWYREPWPWIIFSGPALVVCASLFSAWLAVSHEDGVVAEDYYKQGLAINQVLHRGATAVVLGVHADARMKGSHVQINLSGDNPEYLTLRVVHPTRAGSDQHVMLRRARSGEYMGEIEPVSARHVQVYLEDVARRWRISGTWHPSNDAAVALQARLD
jgi:hypothetical protein